MDSIKVIPERMDLQAQLLLVSVGDMITPPRITLNTPHQKDFIDVIFPNGDSVHFNYAISTSLLGATGKKFKRVENTFSIEYKLLFSVNIFLEEDCNKNPKCRTFPILKNAPMLVEYAITERYDQNLNS